MFRHMHVKMQQEFHGVDVAVKAQDQASITRYHVKHKGKQQAQKVSTCPYCGEYGLRSDRLKYDASHDIL